MMPLDLSDPAAITFILFGMNVFLGCITIGDALDISEPD